MTRKYRVIATVCMLSPTVALAAVEPVKGIYAGEGYVVSTSPTQVCSEAGLTVGQTYAGVYTNPGPSAAGAIFRQADPKSGKVVTEIFSATPAAGAATWSGTFKEGNEPSGPYITVPFSAKITYLDANSFTIVVTDKITVSGVSCTVTENLVLTRTGT